MNHNFINQWIAYFDLLGFSDISCENSELARQMLLDDYDEIISELKSITSDVSKFAALATPVWFSDSFLIYTNDDSAKGYLSIICSAKKFIEKQILIKRPSCGVISFGPLFTDQERNIFIGEALVDAVRMEQRLRSVGLFITATAVNKALKDDLHPERHGFAYIGQDLAYTFSNGPMNFRNPYLNYLEEMEKLAPEHAKCKYHGVINHINKFHRDTNC